MVDQKGLHNQHNSQMSAVVVLQMPLVRENHENLQLLLFSSFQLEISGIPVVWGQNIFEEGCQNFAHAIRWWFVVQRSRYQRPVLPQEKHSVLRLERAVWNPSVLVEWSGSRCHTLEFKSPEWKIWFKIALDQHNAGQCMDLFRVYWFGRQFMPEDSIVMISLSNLWNLPNFWQLMSSSYNTCCNGLHPQALQSSNQQGKDGIGVNMLGGKPASLSFTLIPAQTES